MVETHRCCQSVVDYFPRPVGCLDHSHLVLLGSGIPRRTYRHELAAIAAGFVEGFAGTIEIVVVFGSESDFAGLAFVPRLLGQDFAAVSGELLKEKGILCKHGKPHRLKVG